MKKYFNEIDKSCKILGLYRVILSMYILNFVCFIINLLFGSVNELFAIAGMFQVMFAPLIAIFTFSAFSANYQFLMTAPFKIGNVPKQMYSIFEFSMTLNFVVTTIIALVSGCQIVALFQIFYYLYVLIIGYLIMYFSSNHEMKINSNYKDIIIGFLLDFCTMVLFVFEKLYFEEFNNSRIFLSIIIGLMVLSAILLPFLRKILLKATSHKIRG